MKKFYCTILDNNFRIDYTSKGLNQFNCPSAFVDSDGRIFCEEGVQYKECPVHNLLDRAARIDSKVLDKLVED